MLAAIGTTIHSRTLLALLTGALLAGCGGSTGNTGQLDKPLFAKCGTKGFVKPRAVRVTKPGKPTIWQVQYSIGIKLAKPGQTGYISVIERPPGPVQKPIKDSSVVTIKGRKYSLLTVAGGGTHYAGWATSRARYYGLSDGSSIEPLKRLMVCMP